MKKIAHLIFSLEVGGAENMLIDIINEQIVFVNVSLFIINNRIDSSLLEKVSKKVKIIRITREPGSKNPFPLIFLNLHLLRENPNIIHCHNHNIIEILLPILHKKTLLTIHDTGIESISFKKYAQCFSISLAVKEDILLRQQINTKVISNGISFEIIKPRIINSSNEDKLHIIQISRLHHSKKGQHIAIEAIKLLKEKGIDNVQLDFIGGGDSETYLKQLVDRKNLNDRISFSGIKDRTYIYENLRNYNLLIQPSFYEGFGLTIIEAMAAKIPVLVSNIEGPMEIIKEGKYGFYFEKGNAIALANKIIEIINIDGIDLKMITDNAFVYAADNYNIKLTSLRYLKEYQDYI